MTDRRRSGMSEKKLPSIDELLAQSDRVDNRLLADRRQKGGASGTSPRKGTSGNAERRVKAQDDWGLVEVTVDARGRVQEVAINADLAARTNLADLAEAMLQAARAAQSRADALSRS
nr:YbaB/EbfC family nucleoid-associated protein [Saccharomonospora azurea]